MPPKAGIGSRMVCLGIKPVTGVEELQEGREEVWLREQRSRRLFFPARASVCNPIFCSGAPCARPRNGLPPTILVARLGKPKGTDWSLTVRVRGEERQRKAQCKGASPDLKPLVSPNTRASDLGNFLKRTFSKEEWRHLHLWLIELK